MDKFSKFLETGEELLTVATVKSTRYQIFAVYFFIFAAFFLLYPMLHFGRQSFFVWLTLLLILMIFLARRMVAVHDSYLLTDRRLIFLQAVSRDYYKKTAHLFLSDIKKVVPRRQYSLYIYTQQDRLHLRIKARAEFLHKLKGLLNLP